MKHQYIEKSFRKSSIIVITQANEIIEEYADEGYDLTLRQLYYQFVARDCFPDDRRWRWTGSRWVRDPKGTKNAEPNYKWLGGLVNDARLTGLIDWDSIIDRTRKYESLSHWRNPAEIIQSAADSYANDTRIDQPDYIEVWVEKDALAGVIKQACNPLDIGYFSCRGFVSQTEMRVAAQRFIIHEHRHSQNAFLIHLGDHDPSGIDMSRDIQDRLIMFGSSAKVERIALTMEQIEEQQPPPNPAKTTDSRYRQYREKYGDDSWELDALDPRYMVELVTKAIKRHTIISLRIARVKTQEKDREAIKKLTYNWNIK